MTAVAVEPATQVPPRRRTALVTAVAVGLVVALFVGVLATREPATQRIAATPLAGRPAPALAGPDLSGRQVDLAAYRGQWVVVNFFATWCVPCRREHPALVRFDERHRAAGDAAVVSVIFDDRPADVRRFFARQGGEWPVIEAERAKVEWGVRGVPESFLVDPDGIVLTRVVGGVTTPGLEGLLSRAKQGREARVP